VTPARRRATALVLVGVLVATACVFLGRWQWHRHEWRDAQIAIVEANYDAAPRPVVDVLPEPTSPLPDDAQWRPVTLTGRYLPEATVMLRNRPVDQNPAYHVLVPFQDSASGAVLVVDRGWVPTGEDASQAVDVPAPPTGEVTLVVRLRTAERPSSRTASPGWVHAIAPAQVLPAGGLPERTEAFTGAYGQRVSEDPAPQVLPAPLAEPDLDPGSHLSYAFQWWVFALGALLGLSWLARRELVDERDGVFDPTREPAPEPPAVGTGLDEPGVAAGRTPVHDDRQPAPARRRPRRREGRAEAEEDALIEAQLEDDLRA